MRGSYGGGCLFPLPPLLSCKATLNFGKAFPQRLEVDLSKITQPLPESKGKERGGF